MKKYTSSDLNLIQRKISLEEVAENKKRDFLNEKFKTEIKNIKNMIDFLKYQLKFFEFESYKTLDTRTIFNMFSIINKTNKNPNIIVFHNGGGNVFDIFTFEKGKGKEIIKEINYFAYLINGEFKIRNLYIPSHYFIPKNYDFVLKHF